jgi:hypothetical protein
VQGFWAIGRLIQLWMTLYRPGEGITRARTNSSWPDAPADPVVVELIVGSDWPPIQALLSRGSRGDAGQVVDEHVHVVAMLLPGASSRSPSSSWRGDPAGRSVVNPKSSCIA